MPKKSRKFERKYFNEKQMGKNNVSNHVERRTEHENSKAHTRTVDD